MWHETAVAECPEQLVEALRVNAEMREAAGLAGASSVTYALAYRAEDRWHELDEIRVQLSPPAAVRLTGAVPNPFNPATNISLALKQDSWIRLDVCDARGRLVRVLHEGILTAGNHVMRWDGQTSGGRTAASGLYLARIRDESGISQTRRMMLIK